MILSPMLRQLIKHRIKKKLELPLIPLKKLKHRARNEPLVAIVPLLIYKVYTLHKVNIPSVFCGKITKKIIYSYERIKRAGKKKYLSSQS